MPLEGPERAPRRAQEGLGMNYSTRRSPYVHLFAWTVPLRASGHERVWVSVGPNERDGRQVSLSVSESARERVGV